MLLARSNQRDVELRVGEGNAMDDPQAAPPAPETLNIEIGSSDFLVES